MPGQSLYLRRPNYFDGMELGVADFVAERSYEDGLRRLYNSQLHRWGVARGLEVTIGGDQRSVVVSAGFAIDPAGDEIVLEADRFVAAPPLSNQPADLFVSVRRVRSDVSSATVAAGYKRIEHEPVFAFAPLGASVDPAAVFLGAVVMNERGEISGLMLDARRYCGYDAGAVSFRDPQSGDLVALMRGDPQASAPSLTIQAAELQFGGGAELAGSLTVGLQSPRAVLDVRSSADPLVAISDGAAQPILTVGQNGLSRIGAAAATARLSVDGDIGLDGGRQIGFDVSGALQSGGEAHAINLSSTSGDPMSFVEAGRIDFVAGAKGGPGDGVTPTLSLIANGDVGVGEPNPTEALTVAGAVQSLSGGFIFPGGAVQTSSAADTTVRIGSIIDWWSGGGAVQVPPQFIICDGRTIDQPMSPLNGQTTPNLTGLYVCGTTDYSAIGSTGGAAEHSHQISLLPSHTHGISHGHEEVTAWTEQDAGKGDSDTTDDKCTPTSHSHEITFQVQLCSPDSSGANNTVLSGVVTQPAANTPQSIGLVKLMRIY